MAQLRTLNLSERFVSWFNELAGFHPTKSIVRLHSYLHKEFDKDPYWDYIDLDDSNCIIALSRTGRRRYKEAYGNAGKEVNFWDNTYKQRISFNKFAELVEKLFDIPLSFDYIHHHLGAWKLSKDRTIEFDIVEGGEICYWYHEDNYDDSDTDNTLWNSCMRQYEHQEQIKFYSEHVQGVKLAILTREERLLARCLVWHLDNPYYDRIYSISSAEEYLLRHFLFKNGITQSVYRRGNEANTVVETVPIVNMEFKDIKQKSDKFPYLDSFSFFDPFTMTLTNERPDFHHITLYNEHGLRLPEGNCQATELYDVELAPTYDILGNPIYVWEKLVDSSMRYKPLIVNDVQYKIKLPTENE